MNVSNLQLQGLYLAVAVINNALVSKGVLSREEVDTALRRSEQTALGDEHIMEDMTPANRDAVSFASRFLMLANNSASDTHTVGFHELARMVGETKGHYPDEL